MLIRVTPNLRFGSDSSAQKSQNLHIMPRPPAKPSKGKGRGKTTGASIRLQQSPFLNLALELREIIYNHILATRPELLFQLLLVNRQLSTEVLPFLYKRPHTFDGQASLFTWLNVVDHSQLRHVVDIKFKLQDIDPAKIVGALSKRLREANISRNRGPDVPDSPYSEACDLEVKRIGISPFFKKLKSFSECSQNLTSCTGIIHQLSRFKHTNCLSKPLVE